MTDDQMPTDLIFMKELPMSTESNPAYKPSPIMRYFRFDHLPLGPGRQTAVKIAALASLMDEELPTNAEKSTGLRKLLEAKDCFVRAALPE